MADYGEYKGQMKRLLIWGAGDQATVTLDCALAMKRYGLIDFMEMKEKESREIPGYRIYKEEEGLENLARAYDEAIVATGNNELRQMKTDRLLSMGIPLATVIHPTAVISPFTRIAKGCAVMAYAVVNVNARIETGCILNTGAVVEHDCAVHEFVNICPKAALAGRVTVGKRSFLGIGSTVIDGVHIGADTVVGAGAVVIRDIPDKVTVMGVPAKIKR